VFSASVLQPLSNELNPEKIASIRAKRVAQQRRQVAVGDEDKEMDVDMTEVPMPAVPISSSSIAKFDDIEMLSTAAPVAGKVENDAIMREVQKRERVWRTRATVMQSSGKTFDK